MAGVQAGGAADPGWQPIDDLVVAACSALRTGEMVQCEAFSLFEAMSAVEAGNAKMDSTAVPSVSATQLLKQGAAPPDLSLVQQLAVMDRLLHLEASHYSGAAPLASTVYTSLYMMQPGRIKDACPLLYAYCQGLAGTCSSVRWLVLRGAVSEEEDFNLLITGLPCEEGVPAGGAAPPSMQCVPTLTAAIATAGKLATQHPEQADTLKAITQRLTLRKELHMALAQLQPRTASALEACRAGLARALDALAAVDSSRSSSEQLAAAPGFVEALNRHLLGPAPPRTVQPVSFDSAVTCLRNLMTQVQAATAVADITKFREAQHFIEKFAASKPGVIARSAAHYLLAGAAWATAAAVPADNATSSGSTPPAWVLDRPLLCEALALPSARKGTAGEEVETFLEQAVIAVGNWAQAMLLNPCRQRRRLRRALEDWGNLYQHALNADLSPEFAAWMQRTGWQWTPGQAGLPNPITGELDPQGPLATWAACFTASVEAGHLMAGFELDLYSPSEYSMLYWYATNLHTARRNDLQMLVATNAPANGKPALLPPARGKGKPKAPPPPTPATVQRLAGLTADMMCAELALSTCSALVRLMLGLERTGLLASPPLPFNTLRERFDQRFASFHSPSLVKPEPLSYEHYKEAINVGDMHPSQFLKMAMESFALVKKATATVRSQLVSANPAPQFAALTAEQITEVAALDKVATVNTVAASLVLRGLENAGPDSMQVTFDFTLHKYYPTLKVKTVKAAPAVGTA